MSQPQTKGIVRVLEPLHEQFLKQDLYAQWGALTTLLAMARTVRHLERLHSALPATCRLLREDFLLLKEAARALIPQGNRRNLPNEDSALQLIQGTFRGNTLGAYYYGKLRDTFPYGQISLYRYPEVQDPTHGKGKDLYPISVDPTKRPNSWSGNPVKFAAELFGVTIPIGFSYYWGKDAEEQCVDQEHAYLGITLYYDAHYCVLSEPLVHQLRAQLGNTAVLAYTDGFQLGLAWQFYLTIPLNKEGLVTLLEQRTMDEPGCWDHETEKPDFRYGHGTKPVIYQFVTPAFLAEVHRQLNERGIPIGEITEREVQPLHPRKKEEGAS